jgi:putative Mg2+ transporter-C (MgtC) family protein
MHDAQRTVFGGYMFTDREMIIRLLLAVVLGGLVGLEREIDHKPAGFRTHILVCLGACLFTMLSLYFCYSFNKQGTTDPSRIAAGIVMGVGFLGAGAILRGPENVKGLTTAASIWVVAAIGMAVGCGFYNGGLFTAALAVLILFVFSKIEKNYIDKKQKQ